MRILFICEEYPPGKTGGIGTAVQLLARQLVKMGHVVFVAGLYDSSFGGKKMCNDEGVQVWRFRYGPPIRNSFVLKFYRRLPSIFRRHIFGETAFNNLVKFIETLIEGNKIDLIEVPDWSTFSLTSGVRVRWPHFRVPLVVKSHGSYTYFQKEMNLDVNPEHYDTDAALFLRADALAAVSNFTAAKNRTIFDYDKFTAVLYNGIRTFNSKVSKREEQKVIFSGTLSEKKGIFQLLKAWNEVHQQFPDARLFVYGKGNISRARSILSKKAVNSVHFEGHIDREQLLQELETATMAVFPSFSETFGLMCVEAMSVGCPVIYSKLSCGPEIVENEVSGLLASPADVNDIVSSIGVLMRSKELRDKYAHAAKETVKSRFDIEIVAKAHETFYREVIQSFNNSRGSNTIKKLDNL